MNGSTLQKAINYLKANGVIMYNKDVAAHLGKTEATISRAIKNGVSADLAIQFNAAFGSIFNIKWLLTGEGNMLVADDNPIAVNSNNNIIQGNGNRNIQQVNGHSTVVTRPVSIPKTPIQDAEVVEVCEDCGKPVSVPLVPANIAQSKDEDVWAYINAHKVPRTPVVHQFPNYDMTYQIHSDAMAPRLKSGDYVALRHIGSHPKIFNGEVYCIDTKNTGFIVREVSNMPDGYRLHARSERYGDDFIAYEDVVGVYEVVGAVIMTI